MLVVRVEVWPHGDHRQAKEIGAMQIESRSSAEYRHRDYRADLSDNKLGHKHTFVSHNSDHSAWILIRNCLNRMFCP